MISQCNMITFGSAPWKLTRLRHISRNMVALLKGLQVWTRYDIKWCLPDMVVYLVSQTVCICIGDIHVTCLAWSHVITDELKDLPSFFDRRMTGGAGCNVKGLFRGSLDREWSWNGWTFFPRRDRLYVSWQCRGFRGGWVVEIKLLWNCLGASLRPPHWKYNDNILPQLHIFAGKKIAGFLKFIESLKQSWFTILHAMLECFTNYFG